VLGSSTVYLYYLKIIICISSLLVPCILSSTTEHPIWNLFKKVVPNLLSVNYEYDVRRVPLPCKPQLFEVAVMEGDIT
jgi:hypothetical protein